ncbi:MAG: F0F1 ATP synthase subunit A [Bdellovibrionales bacterium]|nr:F0F1 ATP synthase subunit A [Bdellovibrionales bacterium]
MTAAAHHASWLENLPLLPHDPHYVHVNGAILVFLFLTIVSLISNRIIKNNVEKFIVPSPKFNLVTIVDILIEGLYGLVETTLGKQGRKYFPFIAAVFIFVLFCNLLGLLPMSSAPTANTNTTVAIGLASFIYYNIMGIREHGFVGYLKHFLMGLGPAGIIVALLEMVSHAIRPVSLGIRLFVNMHVDHTVVMSFHNLFAWLLPVPLLLFGIVVCTIQAFVFAVLTAVYVQMATEH